MSIADRGGSISVRDCSHNFSIASIAEERCLIYSSRASLWIRQYTAVVGFEPDKRVAGDSETCSEKSKSFGVILHREPEEQVSTISTKPIEASNEAVKKSPIGFGG